MIYFDFFLKVNASKFIIGFGLKIINDFFKCTQFERIV